MGGSSTGELIYKCGPHDYETRILREFNDHLNRTHNESKAASTSTEEAPSIIEGVPHYTVNKAKVIHDFWTSNGTVNESQPNTVSKAASVSGVNKVKAIHDFLASNGRL